VANTRLPSAGRRFRNKSGLGWIGSLNVCACACVRACGMMCPGVCRMSDTPGQLYTINSVKVQFPWKAYPSQLSMMDKVTRCAYCTTIM